MDDDAEISDDQLAYLNANLVLVYEYAKLCECVNNDLFDEFDENPQVLKVECASYSPVVRVYVKTPKMTPMYLYDWPQLLQYVEDHDNQPPIFK